MKKAILILIILISGFNFAQIPDPPFNPMTANGATGISYNMHTLYWQNPSGIIYNEIYFSEDSLMVANSDTSVKVKNGFPSTVFFSYSLNEYGTLNSNTKYFWKIIEINSSGSSVSPVWYFNTFGIPFTEYHYNFDSNLDGWQIIGPQGLTNWYWSNSTHTQSNPGEAVFRWDPIFTGDSYLMSSEMNAPPYSAVEVRFKYYEDWWSDTVVVGCAYTTDDGSNWTSVWDLHATGNSGPYDVFLPINNLTNNYRIGFYYTGNSNNIDFFYVDEVTVTPIIVLTPPTAPQMMTAIASNTQQNVALNWTPGWAVSGLVGYDIQRKNGNPTSVSPYSTIATTDLNTLGYVDNDVELNQNYTYRVRTLAMGSSSLFGNEATAYVPAVVPVELISFSSSVIENDVNLNWTTATETNNSGFQIERREMKNERSEEWLKVGFVNGHGTTTEPQTYFYKDENLSAGKYEYRLKQIDFDGTFEYSNTIEVEINPPAKFSLEQNYPNPFNPSTNIQYAIANRQFVTIKVFDVLGNQVAILVNEEKPAGNYEVKFIPETSVKNLPAGRQGLASGIYLYQLKAGEFNQTKKMIIIK